ncbi:MAG: DUF362 domain-containing protein [Phycisphaerae bacterium]|nr:DUF362 domain-containing protein [Phycisphaerae bacterium]
MEAPQPDKDRADFSRRVFLRGTAAAALGGLVGSGLPWPRTARGDDPPLQKSTQSAGGSTVVFVQSDQVVAGPIVHPVLIEEMLAASLKTLTGRESMRQCWESLFAKDDIIGLKFNRSAQQALGTTAVVGPTIVRSLMAAGWPPRQLVAIEAPEFLIREFGLLTPAGGFEVESRDFGSGADELARVLNQITALINIPFIKSHNIAGMTCALKNLSHALVKHPARYHGNGCSPYIADIVSLPEIRSKLRLNLVDGLRVVYEGGPEATGMNVADTGCMMASTDPVAADAVALTLLNKIRAERGVSPISTGSEGVRYLEPAEARGLGTAFLHNINLQRIRL